MTRNSIVKRRDASLSMPQAPEPSPEKSNSKKFLDSSYQTRKYICIILSECVNGP